jgi:hypothetical protein
MLKTNPQRVSFSLYLHLKKDGRVTSLYSCVFSRMGFPNIYLVFICEWCEYLFQFSIFRISSISYILSNTPGIKEFEI